MRGSDVLKLARRAEKMLRPILGIGPEWTIDWVLRKDDEGDVMGQCQMSTAYRRAWIHLWPHRFNGEACETIVHELAHVSQWPFFTLTDHVYELLPEDQHRHLRQARIHAFEEHVCSVVVQSTAVKAALKDLQAFARTLK